MGYWICKDFPGKRFEDRDVVKDALYNELWEEACSEFPSWLEDHYNVHALYSKLVNDDPDGMDTFHECMDDVFDENSDLHEGWDGEALDHRFEWIDDGSPSYAKKRAKPAKKSGSKCTKPMVKSIPKKAPAKSASKCTKPYCNPKATPKKASAKKTASQAKKPVKAPAKRRK